MNDTSNNEINLKDKILVGNEERNREESLRSLEIAGSKKENLEVNSSGPKDENYNQSKTSKYSRMAEEGDDNISGKGVINQPSAKEKQIKEVEASNASNSVNQDCFDSNLRAISQEKKTLSLNEKLTMSPLEKYEKYGKYPWKLFLHIFLLILTTGQALIVTTRNSTYARAQERSIYNNFLLDNDKTDLDYKKFIYIYSIDDFQEFLSSKIQAFYSYAENSLEAVEYFYQKQPNQHKIQNLILRMSYLRHNITKSEDLLQKLYNISTSEMLPKEYFYYLNINDLGPFNKTNSQSQIREFLADLDHMHLTYNFKIIIPFHFGATKCFSWSVKKNIYLKERGHFQVSLDINQMSCTKFYFGSIISDFFVDYNWIPLMTLALSYISMMLIWRKIYILTKIYWKLDEKYKELSDNIATRTEDKFIKDFKTSAFSPNNNIISAKDRHSYLKAEREKAERIKEDHTLYKTHLFNWWLLIGLLTNFFQILAAFIALFDEGFPTYVNNLFEGVACFLSSIYLCSYIEYNNNYSIIYKTIMTVIPMIVNYLIGVLPLFFAYALFGICAFWRSERFRTLAQACMTLFSLMFGDSVFDIFTDLTEKNVLVGQIFCYSFTILFMIIFLNIFIAILEEAYVMSKMQNKNHWIYSYFNQNIQNNNNKNNSPDKDQCDITLKKQESSESNRSFSQSMKYQPSESMTSSYAKKFINHISSSFKDKTSLSFKEKEDVFDSHDTENNNPDVIDEEDDDNSHDLTDEAATKKAKSVLRSGSMGRDDSSIIENILKKQNEKAFENISSLVESGIHNGYDDYNDFRNEVIESKNYIESSIHNIRNIYMP